MIWLVLLYAAFLVAGFIAMKAMRATRKEKVLFVTITTIGGILWASLLLHRPLDVNRAIATVIDYFL
ncbi:hypothetical protein SAMN02799624_00844 [Paenibacillus sp. UNC496MF]|uniref:hypothetical protein n=1 Tax=Paenibacillus sp. UNC496MF TaxID=1502753 RepID=UPI0008EA9BB5|nr:hypothetical protein [Paenibacillus sp. UNC496MF]SFI40328.1 hypothetical protein SAMN02799624_00844 [Paenibacillus sp. UNC496MF]